MRLYGGFFSLAGLATASINDEHDTQQLRPGLLKTVFVRPKGRYAIVTRDTHAASENFTFSKISSQTTRRSTDPSEFPIRKGEESR